MRPRRTTVRAAADLGRGADESAFDATAVPLAELAERETLALGHLAHLAIVPLDAGDFDVGQTLVEWERRQVDVQMVSERR